LSGENRFGRERRLARGGKQKKSRAFSREGADGRKTKGASEVGGYSGFLAIPKNGLWPVVVKAGR